MKNITTQTKSSFVNRLLPINVLLVILLALMVPGITSAAQNPAEAPYIIVFKDSENPGEAAAHMVNAYGVQPGFIYRHALKGMSALVPPGRLVALQHDPRGGYDVQPHRVS